MPSRPQNMSSTTQPSSPGTIEWDDIQKIYINHLELDRRVWNDLRDLRDRANMTLMRMTERKVSGGHLRKHSTKKRR